jgi:hypothetical protein
MTVKTKTAEETRKKKKTKDEIIVENCKPTDIPTTTATNYQVKPESTHDYIRKNSKRMHYVDD